MAFENATTANRVNFNSATAGQTNTFWVPEIFSKKVQIAYRNSAVNEAITNTDYMGEIAQYGDTVNIIKEPDISVTAYTRSTTLSGTGLTDQELVLTIDKANYFQFEIDDLETRFSHVNWQAIATDRAGYKLKDAVDADILQYMWDTLQADAVYGEGVANTSHVYGTTSDPIDVGHDSGEVDPLNVLARLARYLDAANVPDDMRWIVAGPEFYEQLLLTNSKLISVDYNGGSGSLRNGLVASGKLRGFSMYKSNNLPSVAGGATTFGHTAATTFSGSGYVVLGGHMSSTASATALTKVETVRSTTTFSDIVRGLHVWGRKVLRPEGLAACVVNLD